MGGEMEQVLRLVADLSARLTRLEAGGAVSQASGVTTVSAPAAASAGSSSGISGPKATYRAMVTSFYVPAVESAQNLGGDFKGLGVAVKQILNLSADIVEASHYCKEPDAEGWKILLKKLKKAENKAFKAGGRGKDSEHHSKAVMEFCAICKWPAWGTNTKDMCDGTLGSTEYHSNRGRIQHKKGDQKDLHMQFFAAMKDSITGIKEFAKNNGYLAGLTWNSKGVSVSEYLEGKKSEPKSKDDPSKVSSPVKKKSIEKSAPPSAGGGMGALFAEIGTKKTAASRSKGLKKLKDSDRVCKNAKLRGNVKFKSKAKASKGPGGTPTSKFNRGRKAWMVENHPDGAMVEVALKDPSESVFIYNCHGAVIQIKGKGKMVSVDKCKKTKVVMEDLLSGCEINNSKSVKIAVSGEVNTFQIDSTDGCLVSLSEKSVGAHFATSKSSEMNVEFPSGDTFVKLPLPEQFEHKVDKGQVKSVVSHVYGGPGL